MKSEHVQKQSSGHSRTRSITMLEPKPFPRTSPYDLPPDEKWWKLHREIEEGLKRLQQILEKVPPEK